jgi:hypothetical protein
MGTKCDLFSRPYSKNAGKPTTVLGLRLVSRIFEELQDLAIQTKIVQPFGGSFQQIKVHQPVGKKGFYTNRDPNKQEVGFIVVKSA